MFFRRDPNRPVTFDERIQRLRTQGFEIQSLPSGQVVARRDSCAAVVAGDRETVNVVRLGLLVGGEIARLVDGGFQKFLETPSGRRQPALAAELKRLHGFQEDLNEALGLESLYNESLGTVCDHHAYDRLTGRE
ncbi:MAG: hypothetical protein ACE141_16805 [Bryobacteraceae bacterium]